MVWEVKKLSEVCDAIFAGGDVPKDRLSKFKTDKYNIPIYANGEKNKGLYGYTDIARVNTPSMTVSARGTIGYSEIRYEPFLPVVRLIVLTPNPDKVTLEYLKYALRGIEFVNSGTSIPQLTVPMIKNYQCSLPSIPEQKRIVALLDTVFTDLDLARAKTEQNLKNARELFESKKLNLFESLSKSSNLSPLPLVCENIFAGGDAPKKGLYSKEKTKEFNIPIYANAVKNNGLYGFTDYSRANEPSITIAARGSGTGHIELRKEPFLPIVRLIVLTPNKEIISLEYLKHALQTLDILRSGSAIPQLTVPMIKEYSIPIPDMISQENIVCELKSLKGYIEKVEAIYNQKLIALDELKKSILEKAFSGELTHD